MRRGGRGEHGRSGRSRRGGVLVLALMAVLAVSALATGILQLSSAVTRRQLASLDGKRAFYMAEAGLAEAYASLAAGGSGSIGSPVTPARFGDGLFWVEAERDRARGTVTLSSTGMVGSGRARAQVVAKSTVASVAALGLFSEEPLQLGPGTFVDGFDSRKGTYASQVDPATSPPTTGGGGLLGSNGDVTIDGTIATTHVFGKVRYGKLAAYGTTGSVTVTGGARAQLAHEGLPPVETPSVAMLAGQSYGAVVPLVLGYVDAGIDWLTIERGSELVLSGPTTVVFNDLTIAGGARLTLDTSKGPVSVFIAQSLHLAPGSVVDTPQLDPTKVSIQVASVGGANVLLGSTSQFHGTIYAPQTEIALEAPFELYGAAVAGSLAIADGARLHMDTALTSGLGAKALPHLMTWRILEMPSVVSGRGMDPFSVLGLVKSACPLPADAHEDVWISVTYRDLGDVTQTYTGFKSGFTLAGVKTVEDVVSYTDDPGVGGVKLQ